MLPLMHLNQTYNLMRSHTARVQLSVRRITGAAERGSLCYMGQGVQQTSDRTRQDAVLCTAVIGLR